MPHFRKILKTVENLAEKPDLTLGPFRNLMNSLLGVIKFGEICKNLWQNVYFYIYFCGAILHQFAWK
jgi:hypothetical protein